MSNTFFGWDLTFRTVEKDIKKKSDVIIAFIHWNLTKNGFRNIGIGEENTLSGDEESSELLPTGWNDNENYSLRYVYENKLFIMHGLNTAGTLIINMMKADDLTVSNYAVHIENTVKEISGPIENVIPEYKTLIHDIKRDLIEVVTQRQTTTMQTQTPAAEGNNTHANEPTRRSDPYTDTFADTWQRPPSGLEQVGRADLNPFAPLGSGGMLFDPFGPHRNPAFPGLGVPGGLPRGAVPPGARFDPFGPPGAGLPRPGRRPPPDADHLPPPGFNDNMFM